MRTDNLQKILKTAKEKIVTGSDETLKALRQGKAARVFLAANCSAAVKEDVQYYAELKSIEVVPLDIPSGELGILCKKPFAISVLCIRV